MTISEDKADLDGNASMDIVAHRSVELSTLLNRLVQDFVAASKSTITCLQPEDDQILVVRDYFASLICLVFRLNAIHPAPVPSRAPVSAVRPRHANNSKRFDPKSPVLGTFSLTNQPTGPHRHDQPMLLRGGPLTCLDRDRVNAPKSMFGP